MANKRHFYRLGFAVVRDRVVHNTGSLRPASPQEIQLWEELVQYDRSIAVDIDPNKPIGDNDVEA